MKTQIFKIVAGVILFGLNMELPVFATTYYSRKGSGLSWHSSSTWSTVGHTSATNTGTYPQAGDIVFISGSGSDKSEVEVTTANAVCSQVTIYGSGNTLSSGKEGKLELENSRLLTVNGNVTLDANGGTEKAHMHLDDQGTGAGSITINGNLILNRTTGSGKVEVIIKGSGIITVNGNLNIIYTNGSEDNKISSEDNGRVNVNGNINMTYVAGSGKIDVNLKDNTIFDVSGNTNFTSGVQSKVIITLESSGCIYYIGGNFVRTAAPNNFGKFECKANQNSTVVYDGNAAQVFAECGGAGTDFFRYEKVIITNTFGTVPQLTLENNEGGGATINQTITMTDGVLRLNSQNLTIVANASPRILGGSTDSYIDATLSNGGLVNRLISGNFTENFQVGDADDYSPFTFILSTAGGGSAITLGVTDALHPNMLGLTYITRYWRLNGTFTSTPSYKVTYDYTNADVVEPEANIAMAVWNGSAWNTYDNTDVANNRISNSSALNNKPLNFDFTGGTASALPIELVSFSGKSTDGKVDLDWKTATEKNNKGFTVQISTDGKKYTDLEFIKGKGNSDKLNSYSYPDMSKKTTGAYYYRLKQEDNNGSVSYSKIINVVVTVDMGTMEISKLYPNPVAKGATSKINITLPTDGKVTLVIYNMMGQKVKELESEMLAGENIFEFETNELSSGTYAYTVNFNLKAISGKFTHLSAPVDKKKEKEDEKDKDE